MVGAAVRAQEDLGGSWPIQVQRLEHSCCATRLGACVPCRAAPRPPWRTARPAVGRRAPQLYCSCSSAGSSAADPVGAAGSGASGGARGDGDAGPGQCSRADSWTPGVRRIVDGHLHQRRDLVPCYKGQSSHPSRSPAEERRPSAITPLTRPTLLVVMWRRWEPKTSEAPRASFRQVHKAPAGPSRGP